MNRTWLTSSVSWSASSLARAALALSIVAAVSGVALLSMGWMARGSLLKAIAFHRKDVQKQARLWSIEAQAPLWTVFRGPNGSAGATRPDSALSSKYRLAGTFFAYSEGTIEARKAVIDDIVNGTQRVLSQGDELGGGVRIVRVERERVVLRDQSGVEAELWLSFRGVKKVAGQAAALGQASVGLGPNMALSKFGGQQVGDHRWVFSRDRLMEYYQELRDEPERLLAVFDSMKPVYDSERRITGYRLEIEGESEFFEASGLKPGDVVRSVNFMEMTNRRRAEFLISQFIRNEANAFIIDIERDGVKKRLIYEIR